jgi:hypothetical protein
MTRNGHASVARDTRFEAALEPRASHGSGEILDLFLWGTLRKARALSHVEVRDVTVDLAAVARDALPRAEPGIHVEHLLREAALFEVRPGGPDEIRIRFRVFARSRSELDAWRAHLHDNLKAIGVHGAAAVGA